MDANQLLREIVEDPENDEPRLVYADWLSDRGDPRGEFIAIQCHLAKSADTDPALPELERRQNDLYRQHSRNWRLPNHNPQIFRRGFVTNIVCPSYGRKGRPKDVEKFETICRSQPIVTFQDWPSWTGDHRQRIRELIFGEQGILLRLFRNEAWPPHLTHLRIDTPLTTDVLQRLMSCEQLRPLRKVSLELPYFLPDRFNERFLNQLAPDAELKLTTSAHDQAADMLRRCGPRPLRIHLRAGAENATLRALLQRTEDNGPRILEFRTAVWAGGQRTKFYRRLFTHPCVKHLELLGMSMMSAVCDREATDLFDGASTLETVRELFLEYHCLDEECRVADVIALPWKRLTRVTIRGMHAFRMAQREPRPAPSADEHPLTKMVTQLPPTLRRLNLRNCQLHNPVAERIVTAPAVAQLTHLNLSRNRLTNQIGEVLLERGPWHNLVALDLRGNSLDNAIKDRLRAQFGNRIWNIDDNS